MKKLIANDYKVLDALKENPNQTRENIASELKINKRTVQRCFGKLVTYDYVMRIGSKNRLLGSLKEKMAFFEMARLSKTRDFTPPLPYNMDKGHLSPYRYEVYRLNAKNRSTIRCTLRKEHIYHGQNITMQLVKNTDFGCIEK